MRSRRAAFTASCLLIAAAIAWMELDSPGDPPRVDELPPEVPYAVPVVSERARLDLTFGPQRRYVLMLGSLGDPLRRHRVTLTAEAVESIDPFAAAPATTQDATSRPAALESGVRGQVSKSRRVEESKRMLPPGHIETLRLCDSSTLGLPNTTHHSPLTTHQHNSQPSTRTFHIHVTDGSLDDPKQYAKVVGRVVGRGRRVRVFLDHRQSLRELAPGLVDEIVRLLDTEIIPAFDATLGRYRDVDGDGTFTVLLTGWLGRLQGGRTSLGGFVRGSDFRCDRQPPFSNRCDMMYLNSVLQPGAHLRTLLVHEYTHAVCFSERQRDEEDWLNEAIAHVAESIHAKSWSNLDYRVARFLDDTAGYPLVVPDYYGADLWRSHGCRGATFLFLRWCADRYGETILPRLIRSPLQGAPNIERAAGRPFDELFRAWTIALWQSGRRVPAGRTFKSQRQGSKIEDRGSKAALLDFRSSTRDRSSQFHSLDLRGGLAGWGLAGPGRRIWRVDRDDEHSLSVCGTAAAFVELCGDSPGPRRIRIIAEPGTRLQVTVLRVADDWPLIDLAATDISGDRKLQSPPLSLVSFSETDAAADRSAVFVNVACAHAKKWTVEHVSLESNSDAGRFSERFDTERLQDFAVADLSARAAEKLPAVRPPAAKFGRADPSRTWRLPFPDWAARGGIPFVVKVVVRDEKGHRAAARVVSRVRIVD